MKAVLFLLATPIKDAHIEQYALLRFYVYVSPINGIRVLRTTNNFG